MSKTGTICVTVFAIAFLMFLVISDNNEKHSNDLRMQACAKAGMQWKSHFGTYECVR